VRTFFLFLCGLTILVLRISQYHVGLRTSNSPFETFLRGALKFQTPETLICYLLSSFLFGLIFLSSVPEKANLGWITYHSGDRARLNERPLFFTCYLTWTAVWAAAAHLYYDDDRLELGSGADDATSKGADSAKGALALISKNLPQVFSTALSRGLWITGLSLVFYPFVQRQFAWGWTMFFLRPFFNLPKTNLLPPSWPYDLWIICRCAYAAFLLSIIWISGNIAFSVFMVREPLKGGKPLTSESKDPNGSLLNGLKSKKLSIQVGWMKSPSFLGGD
jgi:nucleoporin NDC1